MAKLVLLRHGQSTWNQDNRFTGWTDVPLSEHGTEEAVAAADLLQNEGYAFDIAYTSVLKRAIKTVWLALEQMDLMWIPVICDFRLNERHYGALQGLDKTDTVREHGKELVHRWRRGYALRPPALEKDDPRWPGNDPMYRNYDPETLPLTESLADTFERFLPCWHRRIAPDIEAGRRVLITAHGNSLRALIKYLDTLSEDEVTALNIPTGIPLVYELDERLSPIRHYYLGDKARTERAARAVADQLERG